MHSFSNDIESSGVSICHNVYCFDLGNMPCKFRKQLPKGFSRKATKARKANKSLPPATNPSAIELCDAELLPSSYYPTTCGVASTG